MIINPSADAPLQSPEPREIVMTHVDVRFASGDEANWTLRSDRGDSLQEYDDSFVFINPVVNQTITVFKRHLAAIAVTIKTVAVPMSDAPPHGSTPH